MRNQVWLIEKLESIWQDYFADVLRTNIVRIEYGRKAKRRLGSIRLDPVDRTSSIITINPLFKDEMIPEFVIEATIVHELSHYAHGYNSPLVQNKPHPHAGGVMRREFTERGLLELYLSQKRWLKYHWAEVLQKHFIPKANVRYVVKRTIRIPKPFWFIG